MRKSVALELTTEVDKVHNFLTWVKVQTLPVKLVVKTDFYLSIISEVLFLKVL